MYISLDKDGRINASAAKREYLVDAIEFDFPAGFQFSMQHEYKIAEGKLVHDPLPEDPSVRIAELKQSLADTDYIVIKQMEGVPVAAKDKSRYQDVMEQRKAWRNEINKLENVK